MSQGQEGRKRQQMKEVWNLWRTFLHKIVEWRARKYHKLPGVHQHLYSVFWQKICRKEKFVPNGSLTAWLLNRNRNTWKLQHYWNKYNVEGQAFLYRIIAIDLMWVRDFEPEMKSQLNEWSPTSPRPKLFDERNQSSNKRWSSLVITEESSRQSSMRNKCDSSVLSWLDGKITQKNAQKPTWLARGWATHFARQRTAAPGEGCDRFGK